MVSIIAKICASSNPRSRIAPERHDAAQRPHPLQRPGLISALPFSLKPGAEYGQMLTQVPQALHSAWLVWATFALTEILSFESRHVAREAAANA